MKFKNLKISVQLILGFAVMLIFVIILGGVSYRQSGEIHDQTELIYNHSFKVRRAIESIKVDVLNIRVETRDLMLAQTEEEKQDAIQQIENYKADFHNQLQVLRLQYIGSQKDIDDIDQAFMKWQTAIAVNLRMLANGEDKKVIYNLSNSGYVGALRNRLKDEITDIDIFSNKKADSLYVNSNALIENLNSQLIFIVLAIICLMIFVSYWLIGSIRNPVKLIKKAANDFHNGDLTSRSHVETNNEYGELSNSFNLMVEDIKQNYDLNEKTAKLVDSMLSVDNSHSFFREMLPVLSEITNSQMVAVYLLSEDKSSFYHYESVGLSEDATKLSFAADKYEGEFGKALSTHRIQRIKSIPIDTTFVYQTVTGKYIPREIITIPIVANDKVVAVISIASIRKYSVETNKLIDAIFSILTARVEGILVYRQSRKFMKKLEFQNSELEAQKSELAIQSAELKEQNRELEMQKNQLNEVSRLKTNFLSNMSHELRTPLNSVIALSGVLSRRLANKIPTDEYGYLEVIERNGKHLLSLINDILDISRIEAGREEVEISKFSSENMIAELILMIQPQAQQKKIELIQKENNHNIYINSDINKCRHIMQNLIANAVKFTEKGKVEVNVIQHSDEIEISVTDTGIGIHAQHLAHIFDEFRQADSSTSRRYGGTGLGLAIAKKYANLLGGNITVKSVPDEGSVFKLTLPIIYSEEKRVVDEKLVKHYETKVLPKVSTNDAEQKTILLVDDSEPAIIQMKDFMTESGYKILTACNGEEALDVISKEIPDAMILDLMMPVIDGFQVLETIRNAELTAQIPVLILTAKHITKEDLKFLKRNNVHQLIQKGDVNRSELLQAVANLVFVEQEEPAKPRYNRTKIKGKPNILVVEDNSDNMITVKAILGDKFNVIEAIDGNEGIKMAREHIPHLILMDIALPGIDGIEAFKAIRQNGELEHIPVIALTASAMTSDRETILAHGFDSYLVKPIDEKEFFITINEVLFGE